jgi:FtsZ-interacting cell division protein ZipA
MSDLQIGLLIVGAVVIAGVVAYNRIQEVRFRRRAEQAFAPDRADALLESTHVPGSRIEPQLQPAVTGDEIARPGRREPRAVPVPLASTATAHPDSIWYTAEIRAPAGIAPGVLKALLHDLGPLARRVRLEGRGEAGGWVAFQPDAASPFQHVRLSLLLADRGGAVTQQELATFQSAIARCAASLSASAEIPESAPFAQRAKELDAFCADMDLVVGINIVASHDKPITGMRLRALAEAAGFRLGAQGAFIYTDALGGTRFALENQEQTPFSPESLGTLVTHGVTLLLDVPRLSDGLAAFDEMLSVGRNLAAALGATLVDDNRVPVTPQGLEQIRNQLRTIYANMEAHGIPAGSPLALRLFG